MHKANEDLDSYGLDVELEHEVNAAREQNQVVDMDVVVVEQDQEQVQVQAGILAAVMVRPEVE